MAVDSVQASLQRVLSRWIDAVHEHTGALPSIEHDVDWPSPCIVDGPDADGRVRWRPHLRDSQADFSGIERALEEPLHAAIRSFYGSYYSDPLPMRAADGPLTLLQVWSDRDFDRLLENVIGHAANQRRVQAPLTVFIALTDEDDLNLCVCNASGKVVLERPGAAPLREIAPSLEVFLDALEPMLSVDDDGIL
ncbi:MAG: SecY interacting protein Syd [Gammaproteobacteria bacterium]|jgi:SecY interacting protein Syd